MAKKPPAGNPFAALAGLRERLPPGEAPAPATPPTAAPPSAAPAPATPRTGAHPSAAPTSAATPPTGAHPSAAAASAATPPTGAPPSANPRGPARAVVRYERKGRGGKEVTLVDKLGLPDSDLAAWCRELKRALGCGGTVEGAVIVLAGDQRARLPGLLEARGVRRVTVG